MVHIEDMALQLETPNGMLVKINDLEPATFA
ncbi:MAG: hypothetical protein JWN14_3632 [Chthonomonadales bacterium]|nr:hypothetical protein [Chthonomonadales bacterium]